MNSWKPSGIASCPSTIPRHHLSHLDQLEAEAIFVLRETAAQFENPALLFSGGKDSILMAWLARMPFGRPACLSRSVHIDPGSLILIDPGTHETLAAGMIV